MSNISSASSPQVLDAGLIAAIESSDALLGRRLRETLSQECNADLMIHVRSENGGSGVRRRIKNSVPAGLVLCQTCTVTNPNMSGQKCILERNHHRDPCPCDNPSRKHVYCNIKELCMNIAIQLLLTRNLCRFREDCEGGFHGLLAGVRHVQTGIWFHGRHGHYKDTFALRECSKIEGPHYVTRLAVVIEQLAASSSLPLQLSEYLSAAGTVPENAPLVEKSEDGEDGGATNMALEPAAEESAEELDILNVEAKVATEGSSGSEVATEKDTRAPQAFSEADPQKRRLYQWYVFAKSAQASGRAVSVQQDGDEEQEAAGDDGDDGAVAANAVAVAETHSVLSGQLEEAAAAQMPQMPQGAARKERAKKRKATKEAPPLLRVIMLLKLTAFHLVCVQELIHVEIGAREHDEDLESGENPPFPPCEPKLQVTSMRARRPLRRRGEAAILLDTHGCSGPRDHTRQVNVPGARRRNVPIKSRSQKHRNVRTTPKEQAEAQRFGTGKVKESDASERLMARSKRKREPTSKVKEADEAEMLKSVINYTLEAAQALVGFDTDAVWLDNGETVFGRGMSMISKPATKIKYATFVNQMFQTQAVRAAVIDNARQNRNVFGPVLVTILSELLASLKTAAVSTDKRQQEISVVRKETRDIQHARAFIEHFRSRIGTLPPQIFSIADANNSQTYIQQYEKHFRIREARLKRLLSECQKTVAYAKLWDNDDAQELFLPTADNTGEGRHVTSRSRKAALAAQKPEALEERMKSYGTHFAEVALTLNQWALDGHAYDPKQDNHTGLQFIWILAHALPPFRCGMWALVTMGKGGANPVTAHGRARLVETDKHSHFLVYKKSAAAFAIVSPRTKTDSGWHQLPPMLTRIVKQYLTARLKSHDVNADYSMSAEQISDRFKGHPNLLLQKNGRPYLAGSLARKYKSLDDKAEETGNGPRWQDLQHQRSPNPEIATSPHQQPVPTSAPYNAYRYCGSSSGCPCFLCPYLWLWFWLCCLALWDCKAMLSRLCGCFLTTRHGYGGSPVLKSVHLSSLHLNPW